MTMLQQSEYTIEEKELEDMLIAGIRYKGKYSECGQYFSKIGKSMGWLIGGKPFCLYYDMEYKESDADIEACFPIRKEKSVEGIDVRMLPGGRCISLIHKGPYDGIGRSYEELFAYTKEHGHELQAPCREIYIKGPGMIFKGNPRKYLTEVQILIAG